MTLENKVALVTGAAKGIGLATARRLAELGSTVVLSDIDRDQGAASAEDLQSQGRDVRFIAADVSNPDDVDNLFKQIENEFGKLDIAFNNAGIEGRLVPIDQATIEDWDQLIGINLSGVFYCMRGEIPLLRAAGGGVIINCSSIAGLVGTAGGGIYCASKHGVIGLTRAVAIDLATEGIRVNAICPGAIETEMVSRVLAERPEQRKVIESMQPIRRLGTPNEIASAVAWLSQDDAALVTGVTLPLDGGWTAQ